MCHTKYPIPFLDFYQTVPFCFSGIDTLPLRPRQEHSNFLKLSFKQGILEIVFTHTHTFRICPQGSTGSQEFDRETGPIYSIRILQAGLFGFGFYVHLFSMFYTHPIAVCSFGWNEFPSSSCPSSGLRGGSEQSTILFGLRWQGAMDVQLTGVPFGQSLNMMAKSPTIVVIQLYTVL